jgi:predicted RNase H-like HicB family nuclease
MSGPRNQHHPGREKVLKIAGACLSVGMKLSVTIDRDENGVWLVECLSIPGCVSQGRTKEQAMKNIEEAIALCLEVRAERGPPLTVETRQVEVLV